MRLATLLVSAAVVTLVAHAVSSDQEEEILPPGDILKVPNSTFHDRACRPATGLVSRRSCAEGET